MFSWLGYSAIHLPPLGFQVNVVSLSSPWLHQAFLLSIASPQNIKNSLFSPWILNPLALGVLLGWGRCWGCWAALEQSTGTGRDTKGSSAPDPAAAPGACTWVIHTWVRAAQRGKAKRKWKPRFWKEWMEFVLNVLLYRSLEGEKCGFSLLCEKV